MKSGRPVVEHGETSECVSRAASYPYQEDCLCYLKEREVSYCGHLVTALRPYVGSGWCLEAAQQQKSWNFS